MDSPVPSSLLRIAKEHELSVQLTSNPQLDNGRLPRFVLVIGWMGSTPRFLRKYSDFWNTEGKMNTVSYIPTALELFHKRSGLNRARKVLQGIDLLLASNARPADGHTMAKDTGVLLHVFSNNGAFAYVNLMTLIDKDPSFAHLKHVIKGTIFDSLPAELTVETAMGALTAAFRPNFTVAALLRFILTVFFLVFSIDEKSFWHYLSAPLVKWPVLSLYSLADTIVSSETSAKLVRMLKDNKVDVSQRVWTDSKHVEHCRTHPEEYKKLCFDFAKDKAFI